MRLCSSFLHSLLRSLLRTRKANATLDKRTPPREVIAAHSDATIQSDITTVNIRSIPELFTRGSVLHFSRISLPLEMVDRLLRKKETRDSAD